jgi:hypothetical protein
MSLLIVFVDSPSLPLSCVLCLLALIRLKLAFSSPDSVFLQSSPPPGHRRRNQRIITDCTPAGAASKNEGFVHLQLPLHCLPIAIAALLLTKETRHEREYLVSVSYFTQHSLQKPVEEGRSREQTHTTAVILIKGNGCCSITTSTCSYKQ